MPKETIRLILMGAPGAGKGTQGEIISKIWGVPRLAPGDIFRAEIKQGTDLGLKVKAFSDSGMLVPDEVVIDVMRSRLSSPDTKSGWILDGFPRTVPQAKSLNQLLLDLSQNYDYVINIDVPEDILVERLLLRAQIEGRSDDSVDVIKNRLGEYYEKTRHLLDFYGVDVIHIDGTSSLEEVTKNIAAKLSSQS